MLARVASSIYWMNRYIERAENMARFVDANLNLSFEMPDTMAAQWEPLVYTTGDQDYFKEQYGEATKDAVIRFLTFDDEYPNSIRSCLRYARENARTVREIISSEMWRQINNMHLFVEETADGRRRLDRENPGAFFAQIKNDSHLYSGISDATFSHGDGWSFGILGRFLERAGQTSRIIDMKYYYLLPSVEHVGTTIDLLQWTALLKSASAFEMYRKTHGQAEPRKIAGFLLFDRYFPRSVTACTNTAANALNDLTGGGNSTEAERSLERLLMELRDKSIDNVFDVRGLHEYLDDIQIMLNTTGGAIQQTFFPGR